MQTIRAESVPPPNVTCNNTQSFLPRAQSEQPNCYSASTTTSSNYYQPSTSAASFRPQPWSCQSHHPSYRSSSATVPQNNSNRLRYNLNASNLPAIQQRGELNYSNYQNDPHQQMPPAILNNDPNSPLLQSGGGGMNQHHQQQHHHQHQQSQPTSPPMFIHNNNQHHPIGGANLNGNSVINNQLHNHQQQNVVAAATAAAAAAAAAAASSSTGGNNNSVNDFSPSVSVAPALNNQVPPGNRANNYWDNFRR